MQISRFWHGLSTSKLRNIGQYIPKRDKLYRSDFKCYWTLHASGLGMPIHFMLTLTSFPVLSLQMCIHYCLRHCTQTSVYSYDKKHRLEWLMTFKAVPCPVKYCKSWVSCSGLVLSIILWLCFYTHMQSTTPVVCTHRSYTCAWVGTMRYYNTF